MQIYGQISIEDFLQENKGKGLERAFAGWTMKTEQATWKKFMDIRNTFRHVDRFKQCFIFDVGGNKARLVARIDFDSGSVDIMHVMTHKEYDRDQWKECC